MTDQTQSCSEEVSAEQQARHMLERMGVEDTLSFSAGDLVELANMIAALSSQAEQVKELESDLFTAQLRLGTATDKLAQANETIAALQARIEAADKQEPVTICGLFTDETHSGGEMKMVGIVCRNFHTEESTIKDDRYRMVTNLSKLQCLPKLFTRPPITSERELELLAVIEQMREQVVSQQAQVAMLRDWFKKDNSCACETCWSCAVNGAAVLSQTRDSTDALKEHEAKVLEEAARQIFFCWPEASNVILRMADKRSKE